MDEKQIGKKKEEVTKKVLWCNGCGQDQNHIWMKDSTLPHNGEFVCSTCGSVFEIVMKDNN